MKLEAIIVCKDYADFLAETLPLNLSHFDDVVVVTHPDDKETQAVCAKNSVECVKTTVFHDNGDDFNKGLAINVGKDHLKGNGWYLHLDADMVLPHRFRHMLDRARLDPKNIYGADRVNVYGFEAWKRLENNLYHPYEQRWFIDPGYCHQEKPPENTRFGARVVHMEYGWVPIGFFQLWHSSHSARYNYKRGAAAGTDVMFPTQWPREHRVLLPEVVCYHLDSEPKHGIGTNWHGRKSQPFKPKHCHPHPHHKPPVCGCIKHHKHPNPHHPHPCKCHCHHPYDGKKP